MNWAERVSNSLTQQGQQPFTFKMRKLLTEGGNGEPEIEITISVTCSIVAMNMSFSISEPIETVIKWIEDEEDPHPYEYSDFSMSKASDGIHMFIGVYPSSGGKYSEIFIKRSAFIWYLRNTQYHTYITDYNGKTLKQLD